MVWSRCAVSIFFVLFICSQERLFAQLTPSVYIHSQLALDDLSKNYHIGYGGGVSASYSLNSEFAFLLAAGYVRIPGKEVSDPYLSYQLPAITAFPVTIGADYSLNRYLYLRGQAGLIVFNKPENVLGLSASGGLGFKLGSFEFTTSVTHWNKDGFTNFVNLQLAYKLL